MVRAGAPSAQQGIMQLKFPLRESMDNKPYNIIQTLATSVLTSSSVSNVYNAFNFTLSAIDQVTSFTNIFDQYRIMMIEVEFLPSVSQNTVAASNMGLLATVIDYDDSTVLSSFPQALDFTNCLVGTGYEAQRRVFKPAAALAAYSGSFSSYANVTSPWLDSSSSSVQHYGIKTVWTPTTTNAQTITIIPKLWIQFRNVR